MNSHRLTDLLTYFPQGDDDLSVYTDRGHKGQWTVTLNFRTSFLTHKNFVRDPQNKFLFLFFD